MRFLIQHTIFLLRFRYLKNLTGSLRRVYYGFLGMSVGYKTFLPTICVTWPQQVSIGSKCTLEDGIKFKYDGIWAEGPSIIIGNDVFIGSDCEFNIKKRIIVGNDTLIASGSRFIDHDHGMELNELLRVQKCPESEIVIGDNVWIGCNVVVLKGVSIGTGAVIAAGAVVTKSVPSNEIWAGVPARKISYRK